MKVSWNESSSHHDHKSPCPSPLRESSKTTNERIEPKSETASLLPFSKKLEPLKILLRVPVRSSSAEKLRKRLLLRGRLLQESPYLKTVYLPITHSEWSDDMTAAPGKSPYLSGLRKFVLWKERWRKLFHFRSISGHLQWWYILQSNVAILWFDQQEVWCLWQWNTSTQMDWRSKRESGDAEAALRWPIILSRLYQ